MVNNQFYWYNHHDSIAKAFTFRPGGSYMYNKNKGLWKALDSSTIWLKTNRFNTQYTLKFTDVFCKEAVIIKPERDSPSKIKIS